MRAKDITLPENWSRYIRKAMLHIISYAHTASIISRSWSVNSPIERVRLRGKLNRVAGDLARARKQLRLLKSRLSRVPAQKRPHYTAYERLAVLQLKAANAWNLKRTSEELVLDEQTISSWLGILNSEGEQKLLQLREPVNKYNEAFKYVTQQMKLYFPEFGKKRIAEFFIRIGLLSASSVGRFIKAKLPPKPKWPEKPPVNIKKIRSDYPNHIWLVDLTVVPTSGGFWSPIFPNSLPQRFPYCYWLAVIIDHFSRKAIGFAVFESQPSAKGIIQVFDKAIRRFRKKPKHIITDKGSQFYPSKNTKPENPHKHPFFKWCKQKGIHRRHGAVGKYGSIAIVERLIKSIKYEYTRQILVPSDINEMRKEIFLYITWYNQHRPHETLKGRTPQEMYDRKPVPERLDCLPSEIPDLKLNVAYLEGRKELPIIELVFEDKKAA